MRFAAAGAHAALVVTPSFYKNQMTADALHEHYTRVADASALPVLLYNVPGNTGVELTAEVALRLAPHPNIIGLKDSGGDVSFGHLMLFECTAITYILTAGNGD
jgi:4-hydroxy-2-oxoglutarate aldolase